jgi:methionine sulfoxide reductase heme-binding subunit
MGATDSTGRAVGRGWRLFWMAAALLCLMAVVAIAVDPGVEGVRRLIRLTARTSAVLFLASYTASAAARLWPGPATRWQLANRRYLGLAFAFSHALHLAALVAFRGLWPVEFGGEAGTQQYVLGGLAYLFIAVMAATSFEPAARLVGRRAWRWIHTLGAHYVFAIFLLTYVPAALEEPGYWPAVAAFAAAAGVRLATRLHGMRAVAAIAS